MSKRAVRALLLADPVVTGLAGQRVGAFQIPQGQPLPAITLTQISGTADHAHSGLTGLRSAQIQVDCWAEDGAASAASILETLAGAVENLGGYRGQAGGITVCGIFVRNRRDTSADGNQNATRVHRISVDLEIHFKEF